MQLASTFLNFSKPARVSFYTSGSGSHAPETVGNMGMIEIQAGGGGGGKTNSGISSSGGAAGAFITILLSLVNASYGYVVGSAASGATSAGDGAAGSYSNFGSFFAPGGAPGRGVTNSTFQTRGGIVSVLPGIFDADNVDRPYASPFGISGGFGGGGSNGGSIYRNGGTPGWPVYMAAWPPTLAGPSPGADDGGSNLGGGGGGSSANGVGGAGGAGNATVAAAGANGTGYGSGGGGGGGSNAGTRGNGGIGAAGFVRVIEWRTV